MDNDKTIRIEPGSPEDPSAHKVGLLQIIRGEDIGHEYELQPGDNIVGRQKSANVQILDKSISRRHAQIVCRPEEPADRRYTIYDLQSTNGTRVNGEAVIKRELRDADRVHFGSVVCKFMEVDSLEKNFLQEIKKLTEHDRQTELLQMKPFYQRLRKALAAAESSNWSLSMLMMDLDGLKQMNDRHGHLAGTHVIVTIAKLIREEFSPSGVAAIYGGDEFAVYLPATEKAQAIEKAEHLRKIISGLSFAEKDIHQRVSISIGVAEYPADATEMMALVAHADKALYVAKAAGKNRVVAYDPSMIETTKP